MLELLASIILYPIKMALAGVWAFIFSWGLGVGLIICLLLAAYFTTAIPLIGPFLTDQRKHLILAAVAIAIYLGGYYVGARDANKRNTAKQDIVEDTVDKAIDRARRSTRPDPWDRPEH